MHLLESLYVKPIHMVLAPSGLNLQITLLIYYCSDPMGNPYDFRSIPVDQYLWPGKQLNSSCQDIGFICPFVVIDPTIRSNYCSCSELAPELMFDNFLPIPDTESLPFYPLVLKLVVCVVYPMNSPMHVARATILLADVRSCSSPDMSESD